MIKTDEDPDSGPIEEITTYPETYYQDRPFYVVRYPYRQTPANKFATLSHADTGRSLVKSEGAACIFGLRPSDSSLPGPPLRFENPNLRDYLKQETPLLFNQVIDHVSLD